MEEKGQEREGERQNVCKRAYVAHKTYLLSDPLPGWGSDCSSILGSAGTPGHGLGWGKVTGPIYRALPMSLAFSVLWVISWDPQTMC